jgi:PAS domain S-box-containing protein
MGSVRESMTMTPKCLLVDDLEENLVALEALLADEPVRTFRARSGTDALELLLEHDFAVSLIDVQMPDLNGFELAEIMRSTARTRTIPIIFITAGAYDPGRIFQGYEAGAVDFLIKPLDPQIVQSKVRVFLELFQQKRLLEEKLELLRQANEVQARLFESSQDCIMQIDLQGKLLSVSAGGLSALEIPDVTPYIGKPWSAFWSSGEDEQLSAAMDRARRGGAGKLISFRATLSSKPKWWDIIITPVRDAQGKPERLLCVARDVTELKRAEGELEKALAVRDEFLSIASHELRTPLTPLKLQLDMLRRIAQSPGFAKIPQEKVTRMLATSDRQVTHLSNLIEDLLDISRIAAGKLPISPARTDLSEVVSDVLEQFEEQIDAARCSMVADIEPDLVGHWDRSRIEQIVVNLISNACKYASGSSITVQTRRVGDAAQLVVRDRGVGIPADKINRIFDRFERVDSSGSIAGLGLGLYITREIAAVHGGDIQVESIIGEGSTFTVQLPIAAIQEQPARQANVE